MTPTNLPREWDSVDAALAGVVAFESVDQALTSVEESLPTEKSGAGQVRRETEPLLAEARQHQAEAKRLQDETRLRLIEVADEYDTDRAARKQLRRQVFWLRLRLLRLKVFSVVGRVGWWSIMALPRLGLAMWKFVSWPFRSRAEKPLADLDDNSDEGELPRRRFRR